MQQIHDRDHDRAGAHNTLVGEEHLGRVRHADDDTIAFLDAALLKGGRDTVGRVDKLFVGVFRIAIINKRIFTKFPEVVFRQLSQDHSLSPCSAWSVFPATDTSVAMTAGFPYSIWLARGC